MRELAPQAIERAIQEVRVFGYTVIPDALPEDTRRALLDLVETHHQVAEAPDAASGVSSNQAQDKYVYHLQYKDILFLDILSGWITGMEILKPFLHDPYYRQLPTETYNFLIGYYNARSSVAALPLHIDNYVPSLGSYPNSMQIVFSLNGQNAENGATIIVPGSHNAGNYPDRDLTDKAQSLECAPGSAIIWDSRVWHGAAENRNGLDRWSLVATFRPWFLKQNFDPARGTPEAIYAKMNDQQKALMGFLSRPPKDESEKISLKEGFEGLRSTVAAYRTEG
jgi:hypothetical protein